MRIIEQATRDNFFLDGYLRVNPDVAKHVGICKDDAWNHFVYYGEEEKRLQLSPRFLTQRHVLGRTKFEAFKNVLIADSAFRLMEAEGVFPVVFSDLHFSIEDYAIESTNNSYPPFVNDIIANPDKRYLDIGCGLRNEIFDNCLYLEVYPSLTADVIVAPDCWYPFESESFDGIGCFAVLEHVTKPWQVVSEIHRMLKPGGKCYICWPFLVPVHGYPSHYYNATRRGLELIFSDGFDVEFCRTEPWEGPDFTISWVLGKFVDSLPPEKQRRIREMTVADLIAQPRSGVFWSELLKELPDSVISEFACGNSLVATKR